MNFIVSILKKLILSVLLIVGGFFMFIDQLAEAVYNLFTNRKRVEELENRVRELEEKHGQNN